MKKLLAIVASLLLMVGLTSCNNYLTNFYGTYTFDKVSYLSPVSSATVDYLEEKMAGTKYTIEEDLFEIEFAPVSEVATPSIIWVVSPTCEKEELPKLDEMVDAACVIGNEIEYQYTIYREDGSSSGWRLYVSADTLWVSSYVDNTADGSEIILFIYKLSPIR